MKCEYCNCKHDGEYGSGRFCSKKCASGFSTKGKRKEISKKAKERLKGTPPWNKGLKKETDIRLKRQSEKLKGRKVWNKGLTSQTDERVKKRGYQTSITMTQKTNTRSFDSLAFDAKRKRVIKEQLGMCDRCFASEWFGKPLSLEIDHIDGDNKNNSRENLVALCPNCHSITDTWRGRSKKSHSGSKIKNVSDDDLYDSIKRNDFNIRQSLIDVGLTAKGGNYKRCHDLIQKQALDNA